MTGMIGTSAAENGAAEGQCTVGWPSHRGLPDRRLAWIVVYYLASGSIPGLSALGAWNLVVGFGFIIAAVVLATRWH